LLRTAARERQALSIEYAGEGQPETRIRVIHPYQVLESGVRTYVVAWSPDVGEWRHFRLDRIATVAPTGASFEPRADFKPLTDPREIFGGRDRSTRVTVRFHAEVAAWVKEFYVDGEVQEDGSVLVHLNASSPDWLVRRVLEHGTDVEVMEPPEYRKAVRRAVA
jgi:predicted DNA-binding transcriptional regulator YafY